MSQQTQATVKTPAKRSVKLIIPLDANFRNGKFTRCR